MSGWQPIETAPKDGTEILTFRLAGFQAVAEWDGIIDGWVVVDATERNITAVLKDLTHWMPLPPPPV